LPGCNAVAESHLSTYSSLVVKFGGNRKLFPEPQLGVTQISQCAYQFCLAAKNKHIAELKHTVLSFFSVFFYDGGLCKPDAFSFLAGSKFLVQTGKNNFLQNSI
jgi:hypothetical protein